MTGWPTVRRECAEPGGGLVEERKLRDAALAKRKAKTKRRHKQIPEREETVGRERPGGTPLK